jgi:hypothetical protein
MHRRAQAGLEERMQMAAGSDLTMLIGLLQMNMEAGHVERLKLGQKTEMVEKYFQRKEFKAGQASDSSPPSTAH